MGAYFKIKLMRILIPDIIQVQVLAMIGINLIGFGSFINMMNAFIGCSPRVKTKINPIYPIIKGGCPYNQVSKDPSSLKLKAVSKI